MLWFEHDRYDQFVLLRCLAHFAGHGAPLERWVGGVRIVPGQANWLWDEASHRVTHT